MFGCRFLLPMVAELATKIGHPYSFNNHDLLLLVTVIDTTIGHP